MERNGALQQAVENISNRKQWNGDTTRVSHGVNMYHSGLVNSRGIEENKLHNGLHFL
jgi:hypothetical protein